MHIINDKGQICKVVKMSKSTAGREFFLLNKKVTFADNFAFKMHFGRDVKEGFKIDYKDGDRYNYSKDNMIEVKEEDKVFQYENGKLIDSFKSGLEAERITGIKGINQVIRGERKTAGGYEWKRK